MPQHNPLAHWTLGPIRVRACQCGSADCDQLHQRVVADMSRRFFLGGAAAMLAPFVLDPQHALAQPSTPSAPRLLLTNLRLSMVRASRCARGCRC